MHAGEIQDDLLLLSMGKCINNEIIDEKKREKA